jgi:hypothetical protein
MTLGVARVIGLSELTASSSRLFDRRHPLDNRNRLSDYQIDDRSVALTCSFGNESHGHAAFSRSCLANLGAIGAAVWLWVKQRKLALAAAKVVPARALAAVENQASRDGGGF